MGKSKHHLHTLLGFVATLGLSLLAIPILMAAGPYIEPKLLPVLTDMRVTRQVREGDSVLLHIEGNRHRGHCQLEQVVAMAQSGTWPPEMVNIDFPSNKSAKRMNSRPEGFQSFNDWRIRPVAKGDQVTIVIRYECHSLWDTLSVLGPWEVTE